MTAQLPRSSPEAQSPLTGLKRSYFSLNFLSDFIEKNSGLGAFHRPSPRLPLGQKHLFTRCPVSTRWGPWLRTGKEATGGPASALEPRRESESDTHTHSRARALPNSPSRTRTARSRARPQAPGLRPPTRPSRSPFLKGAWGGGGAGRRRGQGDTQKRAGTGAFAAADPGGFCASSRGHQEGRAGGKRSRACGSRVSGMERWGPGEERGRASPAA